MRFDTTQSSIFYKGPYFEIDAAPYGRGISPSMIDDITGEGPYTYLDSVTPLGEIGRSAWGAAAKLKIASHLYYMSRRAASPVFSPMGRYYSYRSFHFGGPIVGDIAAPIMSWANKQTTGSAALNDVGTNYFNLGRDARFYDPETNRAYNSFEMWDRTKGATAVESMVLGRSHGHITGITNEAKAEFLTVFGIKDESRYTGELAREMRDAYGKRYGIAGKYSRRSFASRVASRTLGYGRRAVEIVGSAPGLRYAASASESVRDSMAAQREHLRSLTNFEVGAQELFSKEEDIALSRTRSYSRATRYGRAKGAILASLYSGEHGIDRGAYFEDWINLKRDAKPELLASLRAGNREAAKFVEEWMNPAQKKAVSRYALNIARKEAVLSIMRVPLGMISMASFVAPAVTFGIKAASETAMRLSETVRQAVRMDFGGDDAIVSSRLASERQRQMAAIANTGLNARGLMGGEAQYYHGS